MADRRQRRNDAQGPPRTDHAHDDLRLAIHAAFGCHQICLGAATPHCLEIGGDHAKPAHLRLTLAGAEVCRAAAQPVVEACRHCAEHCRKLAG